MLSRILLTGLTVLGLSSPAFAHLDPEAHGSFASGFTHPIFGLDHVLAMIAVGLWAVLLDGKALWGLPSAFVGAMIAGFGLALAGVPLPAVEPMIMGSVVLLGALVAFALQLKWTHAAVVVGIFGLFHGYAHGGEIGSAGELGYALGFVVATALLHALGLLIGYAGKLNVSPTSRRAEFLTRILGAATAVIGLTLIAG
ncbi:MAG: HupE/UreJ family protein [Rhodobacteraceae bacterium]|nr:HupE/UreJ family protein [Paracoccaceae bacterium]